MTVLSCPIRAVEPPFVFLAASFEVPHLLFVMMNDALIASLEAPQDVASHYDIPERKPVPKAEREDFSLENEAAQRRRRDTSVGTHPDPRRIPGDAGYVREQLVNEVQQIQDLIELIDKGGIHHGAGLAARLRLLIAEGKPLPLLQLAAAAVDAPLIVFTCAKPRDPIPMPLSPVFVSFEISSAPALVYENPIDLDVWLDLHAAVEDGKRYSHKQAIKAIGNTAGAHIDRDIHPLVAMLRSTKSAAVGGSEYDLVLDYVRHLAIIALQLSRGILARS